MLKILWLGKLKPLETALSQLIINGLRSAGKKKSTRFFYVAEVSMYGSNTGPGGKGDHGVATPVLT